MNSETANANEELIKFIKDNDITNINTVLLEEYMNKQKIIKEHPYKISKIEKHGKTFYMTYVTDETKRNHRRQITAMTETDLENKIYEAYQTDTIPTFEKVSSEWLKSYKQTVKETTFSRTMSTYKKFMPTCSLCKKDIRKIKMIDVKNYLQDIIIQEELLEKAYKNLKSMLNGIFVYALEKELISKNPMTGMNVSLIHLKQPEKKEKCELVFTDKEKILLLEIIEKDTINFKTTSGFAILLSFQLGLRVSELVALKWSDIKDNTIHIQREEIVYDEYDNDCNLIKSSCHKIVERTKSTSGNRFLHLTPKAIKILKNIKSWNEDHDIHSEFIFSDKNGNHFNRQRINTCLYNYCEKIDIIKIRPVKKRFTTECVLVYKSITSQSRT